MDDSERQAILAEILEDFLPARDELPRPNFTVQEVIDEGGVTESRVRARLERLEREGTWTSRMAWTDGHRERVFWKLKGDCLAQAGQSTDSATLEVAAGGRGG
jgi:hypothetical protein